MFKKAPLVFFWVFCYSRVMKIRVFAINAARRDFTGGQWSGYLSEERKASADSIRQQQQRQLFLGAEILLNLGLERIKAPLSLPAVCTRNQYGKPYLADLPDLYVNWSHSGTCILCAFSDQEIGADLQNTIKKPKDALIRRTLQPEERIWYDRAAEKEKKQLFYRYWTMKESYLKALGTGFHTPLDTFFIRMEGMHPDIIRRDGGESYTCRILDYKEEDYAAAVCVKGAHPDLETYIPVENII